MLVSKIEPNEPQTLFVPDILKRQSFNALLLFITARISVGQWGALKERRIPHP